MTQAEFKDAIRDHLRREPFQPFVVEMLDGRLLDIDAPSVALGGGEGGFITADKDVIFFACEDVRAIRGTSQGVLA